jgi:hypothetical protein
MRLIVINSTVSLDSESITNLRRLGLNRKKNAENFDRHTQLLRDMNIYGDIAESIFEQLRDEFNVDISGFFFHAYFPGEFPNHSGFEKLKYMFNPFRAQPSALHSKYKPITIGMIQDAIKTKVWRD